MNILLTIGLFLVTGYIIGWILDKLGLPRLIGYIITGIAFSPHNTPFISIQVLDSTHQLMEICIAFIAFEVGGTLKWSKLRKHKKEITSITILASLIPYAFIAVGIFLYSIFVPGRMSLKPFELFVLVMLLGALASPTAPATTLAVMRQYKARGPVTDTILGVVALDDILGVLLFSLTLTILSIFTGGQEMVFGSSLLNTVYQLGMAILVGYVLALVFDQLSKFFKIKGDGQWVVLIFSQIILCAGISSMLHLDELLAYMVMGMTVSNQTKNFKTVFRILERYTEDLIFLFFFVLSGLHLDIGTIGHAAPLILLFVGLRATGKVVGANLGSRIVHAHKSIRRYTAGGLLPQAGVVLGLVLSIYKSHDLSGIADILLTTIMGATIVNELLGPIATKFSLKKAGELTALNANSKKLKST